jgi:hypothetical protein
VVQKVSNGAALFLLDGEDMHKIMVASRFEKPCEVIEVHFKDDLDALLWVRPRRKRSTSASASVNVKGSWQPPAIKATFIDVDPGRSEVRRSRSEGAPPSMTSRWSRGTCGDCDSKAGIRGNIRIRKCQPCTWHRRFLLGEGTGCKFKHLCRYCHASTG